MSFEYIQRLEREILLSKHKINFLQNNIDLLNDENVILKTKNQVVSKKLNKTIDTYRCVVCLTKPKNIILQSCFHFVICYNCLEKLDVCPICREKIDLYNIVY